MRPTTKRAIRAHGFVVVLLLALLVGPAIADTHGDDRRALVTLRVLAYDKRLDERAPDVVRIVIVSPKGDDGEAARWRAAFAKTAHLKIGGRSVSIVAHELDTA